MADVPRNLVVMFEELAARLKSSQLLWLVGGLFILDLFIPDPIPFVDEIILGLLTLLIARWKGTRDEAEPPPAAKPPPKDVTPKTS